jgi:hypothetical protein
MESDPVHTRAVIGEVVEDAVSLAGEMLLTANESMSELVVSGYGVEPEGFYAEVMRLVEVRLRSIGYLAR